MFRETSSDILDLINRVQDLSLNSRVHRSGNVYNMADSNPNTPSQSNPQNPPSSVPLTIVHDHVTGPKFTGQDDGLSVYTFIREAEDTIRKRQLNVDQDKINVLRERVSQDPCPARSLLFTDFFLQCKSFDEFKKALIKTFASTSKLGPISSLFTLASIFREGVKPMGIYDALMHASTTQSSFVDQFRDTDWVTDGKMSLEHVSLLLSYVHFLSLLDPAVFKKIMSSQLKPDDSLWLHAQEFFSYAKEASSVHCVL